jgi:hypothetical protein
MVDWVTLPSSDEVNSGGFGIPDGLSDWPQCHVQFKSNFSNGRQRTWNRSFVGPANAEIKEEDWGEWRLVSDLTDEEVAQRNKEEREARERDPPKDRWTIAHCYDGDRKLTRLEVCDRFGDLARRKAFAPNEADKAKAEADEWNRFDRQGPLPPEFETRRRNLAKIESRSAFDSDPPTSPERYALKGYSNDWGEWVDLHATLDEALAEAAAEGSGVVLWDLDTGEELPIEVTASLVS